MLCANSSASCGVSVSVGVRAVFDLWAATAALQSCAIKQAAKQGWVQPASPSICYPELFLNVLCFSSLRGSAVMLQVVYL